MISPLSAALGDVTPASPAAVLASRTREALLAVLKMRSVPEQVEALAEIAIRVGRPVPDLRAEAVLLSKQQKEASLLTAALAAHAAGVCVLPPREDGSKAPMGSWKQWTKKRPTEQQVRAHYGKRTGLGVVLGAVSGGLEALDFDAVGEAYEPLRARAREIGLGALVAKLDAGYLERTAGGGIHWVYRCTEVEGNQRLAQRSKRDNEKTAPEDTTQVLIETRGEGGYLVTAPSFGAVHASGKPYVLLGGGWDSVPTLTPEERRNLHELARSFDTLPGKVYPPKPHAPDGPADAWDRAAEATRSQKGDRPGDAFNTSTTWAQVLEPHGWVFVEIKDDVSYWRRPGKPDGVSATTNYAGSDLLKVFTSTSGFEVDATYNRFGAWTVLNHGGDHAAAARDLAARGYDRQQPPTPAGSTTKRPIPAAKPVVRMRLDLYDVAREAERNLVTAGVPLYVRAGELVRLIRDSRGTLIRPLPKARLLTLLAQHMRFVAKVGKEDKDKAILPPRPIVDEVHEAGEWPFPELEAVVVAPTMRPDGTVLDAPGYDAATRLMHEPNEAFPRVSEAPTLEDAQAALRVINEPFAQFPFKDRCDRSAAWALVLSVLGRGGYRGATPIFVVRTPTPGTGKNLLTQVVGVLALRRDPPAFAAPEKAEEWYKKLGQHVVAGHRFTVIDECHRLDSRDLASAITQEYMQDRLMGGMDEFYGRLPVYATCGNNTVIAGDFGRRVVPIEIDSGQERPEGRRFAIEDLPGWCYQNRARVVAAALTVLRAYVVAGRPDQHLQPMGSFERWSRFVRSALVWCGAPDPVAGQARIRADADVTGGDAHEVLSLWRAAPVLDGQLSTRQVCEALQPKDRPHPLPELRDMLLSLVRDPKQRDTLRANVLGYVLRGMRDRPIGDLVLRGKSNNDKRHTLVWWVEAAVVGEGSTDHSPITRLDRSLPKHHSHIDLTTQASDRVIDVPHGETFEMGASKGGSGSVDATAHVPTRTPVYHSPSCAESQQQVNHGDTRRVMGANDRHGMPGSFAGDEVGDEWPDGRE